ncbi:MAG TPA: alpha/beta hydrolase [Jatrophihabitantaceae bacterium]|jgi:pimeloyl-ACP methyl ester carboxylesterase/predicted small secreted protein
MNLRRRRAVAAVLGLAALALAGCTSTVSGHGTATASAPAASSSANVPTHQISYTDCKTRLNVDAYGIPASRLSHLSFQCGTLAVPLDYADPTGTTIDIVFLKVHDDRNTTGDSLMMNPGGPGGSGISLALGLTPALSDGILANFDLIGFDPRGVGESSPINCVSDADKDKLFAAFPDVRTNAGFTQAKSLATEVASACETKYGSALADYDTEQTARDMEQLRIALGNRPLNYLGFSYGTELGAAYAHLFPNSIRVAVLDGAVDPLTSDISQFADQLGGFESAFDQFQQDCLTRSPCKSLGSPRQVVYQLVRKAIIAPIPNSNTADPRKATGALILTGVLQALYSQSEWPDLGTALLSAQQGDSKGLLALADEYNERNSDGTYTNIYDANTTISCNDSKPGPTDATVRSTAQQWATKYPMFGVWSAGSLFSCQSWQPRRTPPPLPSAATPNKVLVIGNLHDPATPYQGAKDLTHTLGNAELLTWNGEGHTSYLQGSSCIDNYVNSYLIAGSLPPANTTCPR